MRTCLFILGAALLVAGCSHEETTVAEQANAERAASDALQRHGETAPGSGATQNGGAHAATGLLR